MSKHIPSIEPCPVPADTAPEGPRHLTLEEKLALFDPATYAGEAMPVAPVGAEAM
ncbi:unnamed protein product [marine sediment metagenome]|uniref:Uncharacterized protein n=1 Tax=marine sediment metagenome TaxID=412755 RepID=X1NFQ2_9ZZZZ